MLPTVSTLHALQARIPNRCLDLQRFPDGYITHVYKDWRWKLHYPVMSASNTVAIPDLEFVNGATVVSSFSGVTACIAVGDVIGRPPEFVIAIAFNKTWRNGMPIMVTVPYGTLQELVAFEKKVPSK